MDGSVEGEVGVNLDLQRTGNVEGVINEDTDGGILVDVIEDGGLDFGSLGLGEDGDLGGGGETSVAVITELGEGADGEEVGSLGFSETAKSEGSLGQVGGGEDKNLFEGASLIELDLETSLLVADAGGEAGGGFPFLALEGELTLEAEGELVGDVVSGGTEDGVTLLGLGLNDDLGYLDEFVGAGHGDSSGVVLGGKLDLISTSRTLKATSTLAVLLSLSCSKVAVVADPPSEAAVASLTEVKERGFTVLGSKGKLFFKRSLEALLRSSK